MSAPWRIDVPMQSDPVSPPPMTTTCLPSARIGRGRADRLVIARNALVLLRAGIPSRSGRRRARGPGCGRSRGFSAPPASTTASIACRAGAATDTSTPTCDARCGRRTPSAFHLRDAAVDEVLLHLEIGNAVAQQAADAFAFFSNTVHVVAGARQLLRAGEARRARADDRDASCRCAVVRRLCGLIQPSSQPRSTIAHSIGLDRDRAVVEVERAGRPRTARGRCGR